MKVQPGFSRLSRRPSDIRTRKQIFRHPTTQTGGLLKPNETNVKLLLLLLLLVQSGNITCSWYDRCYNALAAPVLVNVVLVVQTGNTTSALVARQMLYQRGRY